MIETFSNEPQFLFSIVALAGIVGIPAVTILSIVGMWTWRKHQSTKMAHELKTEMVAAGMSAEEIERVLAARMNER